VTTTVIVIALFLLVLATIVLLGRR